MVVQMKYRVTIEVNDPEGAFGDSPDPGDVEAWARYLDLETDDDTFRLVKVEIKR